MKARRLLAILGILLGTYYSKANAGQTPGINKQDMNAIFKAIDVVLVDDPV